MQTYLPFSSFDKSARCLDNQRLGKQRKEAWWILKILQTRKGNTKHPAVKMWKGYESALAFYGLCICREWVRRGFKDTLHKRFRQTVEGASVRKWYVFPAWLNSPAFHRSHRSYLLRKDPKHYKKKGLVAPVGLRLFWPSDHGY